MVMIMVTACQKTLRQHKISEKRTTGKNHSFGSESCSGLDPDTTESVNPDTDPRKQTLPIKKIEEISCLQVLDVLFKEL